MTRKVPLLANQRTSQSNIFKSYEHLAWESRLAQLICCQCVVIPDCDDTDWSQRMKHSQLPGIVGGNNYDLTMSEINPLGNQEVADENQELVQNVAPVQNSFVRGVSKMWGNVHLWRVITLGVILTLVLQAILIQPIRNFYLSLIHI